jgi:hypothetical protein
MAFEENDELIWVLIAVSIAVEPFASTVRSLPGFAHPDHFPLRRCSIVDQVHIIRARLYVESVFVRFCLKEQHLHAHRGPVGSIQTPSDRRLSVSLS